MTTDIHHLSRELLPIGVTKDGAPVTAGVECSFDPQGVEPSSFSPADTTTDGVLGYLYDGTMPPGYYTLTVKVLAGEEEPVMASDLYRLT
jgi:hypothetical protein